MGRSFLSYWKVKSIEVVWHMGFLLNWVCVSSKCTRRWCLSLCLFLISIANICGTIVSIPMGTRNPLYVQQGHLPLWYLHLLSFTAGKPNQWSISSKHQRKRVSECIWPRNATCIQVGVAYCSLTVCIVIQPRTRGTESAFITNFYLRLQWVSIVTTPI